MQLAVSNLAWTNEEEAEIAELLKQLGVKHIEIAPTKRWQDPTKTPKREIDDYMAFWHSHGLEIVAFQAMMFPRPDLKIFESAENRAETLTYLQDFIDLASAMKAGIMVFGSPKNRQRGDISINEATDIAKTFFDKLGDRAKKNQVQFCIEPNAPQYACDFVTTAKEGIEFVKAVNNPGLGLHLDTGCMTMAGDDMALAIREASNVLRHFHISSPFLEQVEAREDVRHQVAATALQDINYKGFVSIEMRPGEPGQNAKRVGKAVRFAKITYGV